MVIIPSYIKFNVAFERWRSDRRRLCPFRTAIPRRLSYLSGCENLCALEDHLRAPCRQCRRVPRVSQIHASFQSYRHFWLSESFYLLNSHFLFLPTRSKLLWNSRSRPPFPFSHSFLPFIRSLALLLASKRIVIARTNDLHNPLSLSNVDVSEPSY